MPHNAAKDTDVPDGTAGEEHAAPPTPDSSTADETALEKSSPQTPRALKDPVLTSAVEFARVAAEQIADSPLDVGEHVGVIVEDERLASHRFACTLPGYVGWTWVVTLARVPRSRSATICEVELMPGDGSLLAPKWIPWSERLRPGDIGPGDVLPFQADDPRLAPGWKPTGDPSQDDVAIDDLALARARVLTPDGREDAAKRWYRGARGPKSPGAVRSSEACLTCGFFVRLQGPLGQLFGVCANEWSPDDGKVVSVDHGCGAHSESDVISLPSEWPAADPLIDEVAFEVIETHEITKGTEAPEAQQSVSVADAAAEGSDEAAASESTESVSTESAGVGLRGPRAEPGPEQAENTEPESGAADSESLPALNHTGDAKDDEDPEGDGPKGDSSEDDAA